MEPSSESNPSAVCSQALPPLHSSNLQEALFQSSLPAPALPPSERQQLQFPLSLADTYEQCGYQPGRLHLVPCTFEEYLESHDAGWDRYELVEGVLVWESEIPDHVHDVIRDGVAELLHSAIRRLGLQDSITVKVKRTVDATGDGQEGMPSGTRSREATIRRPDIVVLNDNEGAIRGDLSPLSQHVAAPRGYPPRMSVDVTTWTSREVDLHMKCQQYASSNIEEYVIIDRDLPSGRKPRVLVFKLEPDDSDRSLHRYTRTEFRNQDLVRCSFLETRGCTAQDLLNPPPAEETASSPERTGRRLRMEAERRAEEEHRKWEKAVKKTQKYRDRYRCLGELLRQNGIEVSESSGSSESCSPERKKLRNR